MENVQQSEMYRELSPRQLFSAMAWTLPGITV